MAAHLSQRKNKVLMMTHEMIHDLIVLSVTCLTSPLNNLCSAPSVPAMLAFLLPLNIPVLLPHDLYSCCFPFPEMLFLLKSIMNGSLTFTQMSLLSEADFDHHI